MVKKMAEKRTFVFYPDWLDFINKLENEHDKYEALNMILVYGCTGEILETDNSMAKVVFETFVKPRMDKTRENYESAIERGKTGGRRKAADEELIEFLAKQGFSAKEIAERAEVSVTTVYHSDGWRNRNKE